MLRGFRVITGPEAALFSATVEKLRSCVHQRWL